MSLMACSLRWQGQDKTVFVLSVSRQDKIISTSSRQREVHLQWYSHHRHGQDCIVLSVSAVWTPLEMSQNCCLVCSCVHTVDADKTRQFYRVSNCVHTADADKTKLSLSWPCWRCEHNCRQNKTVLSCQCRWCEQAISCKLDKTLC